MSDRLMYMQDMDASTYMAKCSNITLYTQTLAHMYTTKKNTPSVADR